MKTEIKTYTDYEENEVNPFTEHLIKHMVEGTTRTGRKILGYKPVFANKKGKAEEMEVVKTETGERQDVGFNVNKLVDREEFGKLYTAHIGMLFELSKTGIRVLAFILKELRVGDDFILFSTDTAIKKTGFKSKDSLYKGLTQLVEAGIIAKSQTSYKIFINPMIIFNGDRATFATTYVKEKAPEINHENPIVRLQQYIDYK